jgi:chorismate mutase/prephenate dehydratase
MEEHRKKINKVDSEIIKLLARRRDLSREIILFKNKAQSSIRDKAREKELLKQLVELGKKEGLDSDFVTKIYLEIIDDSVKLQNKILSRKKHE